MTHHHDHGKLQRSRHHQHDACDPGYSIHIANNQLIEGGQVIYLFVINLFLIDKDAIIEQRIGQLTTVACHFKKQK